MIPLFKVFMPNVSKVMHEVLNCGYVGQGPKVDKFEAGLEKYIGKAVATNSCTSALQMALELIDVRGKYVLSTPATCTATNIAILNAGGKIVWADVNPVTGNIKDKVFEYRGESIAATVCVHYGGRLCSKSNLLIDIPIVEDCAHRFNKGLGGYECYSFQAIKFLTTIDGGALVCPNEIDHERAKLMRWFGIDRSVGGSMRCMNPIYEKGYKFNMNDVNATIGIEQLKYVEENVASHKTNAKQYCKEFKMEYDDTCDYWLFVIHVPDRDGFIQYMDFHGIETSIVHGRNDLHPIFKESRRDLPGVDKFYSTQVSIPVGWWLTSNHRDKIIERVKTWQKRHS